VSKIPDCVFAPGKMCLKKPEPGDAQWENKTPDQGRGDVGEKVEGVEKALPVRIQNRRKKLLIPLGKCLTESLGVAHKKKRVKRREEKGV